MTNRWPRFVCAALVAAAASVWSMTPAAALAPQQYGWWTQQNPGGGLNAAARPPDVPGDGMLVQGASSNPIAVAAVAFTLPSDLALTSATLNLTVAPNSVDTPSGLQVCALNATLFKPAEGGPISDAPGWDCGTTAVGTLSSRQSSWSFPVIGFVAGNHLAVAILGSSATDRVAFAKPTAGSLSFTTAPTPSTTSQPHAAVAQPQVPRPDQAPAPAPAIAVPSQPAMTAPAPALTPAVAPPANMPPLQAVPQQVGAPTLLATTTAFDPSAAWATAVLAAAAALVWRSRRRLLPASPSNPPDPTP